VITSPLPAVWALALTAMRWFVPAESAQLGETLWIVQLWLFTACAWSLFVVLRRCAAPRFDRADAAVWLLAAGHVVSAMFVLSTGGQKRAAQNMLWEWVGFGVSTTLLRHWLRGGAGLQEFARTLTVGAVVLSGLGLWQYGIEFPGLRRQLTELVQLEHQLGKPDSSLSRGDLSRLRDLRQDLGSLATEHDPVARFKLRQRLLDSTEPLGRFALTNTLAGFLAAGFILLMGGASTMRRRVAAKWRVSLLLLSALLVAFCLVLTKSRTAWTGLLVGAFGWGLLSLKRSRPLRLMLRSAVAAGFVLAALVLIAAWSGGLDRLVLTEAPKSLGYRREYWTASVGTIQDHPLFGTGPGNFRQHYLKHKLPGSSEEILDPHNQFLDVWAGGGLLALAGLAWVWLQFLQRCRDGDPGATEDTPVSTPSAPHWQLPAVGCFALLLLFGMQFLFEAIRDLQAIALLAGWLVAALVLQDVPMPRIATLAAGLALGVHLLGAGGIAMPAISVPLMLLLLGTACRTAPPHADAASQTTANDEPQRMSLRLIALLGLLALAGACLVTSLWPSYYARVLIAVGESAVYSGYDRAAARRDFEAAAAVDNLDPDPWYDLAGLDYAEATGDPSAANEAFERAIKHLREAIRRDPLSPKLHWTAGQWQFARFQSTGNAAALDEALQSMERARQGYPNHAGIRAARAEVLAALKRPDAVEEARVALRLDDLNQERGHIDVWLSPETRERVQAIVDQSTAAAGSDAERPP
jgi:hypothetical protein